MIEMSQHAIKKNLTNKCEKTSKLINPSLKYRSFPQIDLVDRTWPGHTITHSPIWCSVDLRDGNQALPEPMGLSRKLRMFEYLINMGFKEIEVGFPAASQTDFDFVRYIIEQNLIPEDVTIQILTQARDQLIYRTFESIQDARRVIVHLYNSTSILQRRVVFGLDKTGIIDIAVKGAKLISELARSMPATEIVYEYSPESFTGTELEYAIEICEAIMEVYQPTEERRIILNLPATVEMATPNIYADQIEWFLRNVKNRNAIILSVHPHNDRGTAVAAAELAQMAGADRVEGTLFGNGERTGNVDIVTLALNLFTQGIDPKLDLSDIDSLVKMTEYCNQLPIHPRHPYAGTLVYTAFSGSHQDAINKGMKTLKMQSLSEWQVPYLPIDPLDVGRTYEAVIRINSQSGKGGIAYLLEQDYGIALPRELQVEFSKVVQEFTDQSGKELSSQEILEIFRIKFLEQKGAFVFIDHHTNHDQYNKEQYIVNARIKIDGFERSLIGIGTGPIDGFAAAIAEESGRRIEIINYHEHSLDHGANAKAIAYLQTKIDGYTLFGVGIDQNITTASLKALISAVNQVV